MGKIVRQGEVIPVQARRTGPVPPPVATVQVPGGHPAPPPPPPAAGGPQNVIYVVNPPAAPTPPPIEIHHHHHHTTEVPARRRRRSKGTSFLGTLGLVVGGVACVAAFLPPVAAFGKWLGLAGLAMATLAWVGAVLLRRVGAAMPFAGMVVAAAGYALSVYNLGQGQATYDLWRAKSPVALPALRIPSPAAPVPATVDPTPTAPGVPAPAAVPGTPTPVVPAVKLRPVVPPPQVGEGTIFDPASGGWVKPTTRP